MTSFLPNFPKLNLNPNPNRFRSAIIRASVPARDRVIDFGKYKGRMLGTLPSTYLKWVSHNLRARDFEEWAQLADNVLQDPVYKDRVEWEHADRLLNGNSLSTRSTSMGTVDEELVEISRRFGWDNEDKVGWGRVNFELLGTSKGGRIPRVKEGGGRPVGTVSDSEGEKPRMERRERLRMRRIARTVDEDEVRRSDNGEKNVVYNPFPGRENLIRKVLNRRKG